MGNKPQKPVDQLQYTREGRAARRTLLLPVTDTPRPIPPAPKETQPNARRRWRDYWRSPIARAVNLDSDGEAIYRWLHCISERERLQPLADKTPLVKGSTGQLVANPLYGIIAGLSREIERLEEHLGMTPLARMRLGITAAQETATVHDLRQKLECSQPAKPAGVIDLDALG